MKSRNVLIDLLDATLHDVASKCAAPYDMRDLDTLRLRVEKEGLSFLTITLPDLGSDFDHCLTTGRIAATDFRMVRKTGRIPSFLKGIFGLVFNSLTGELLNEPSIAAIEGIRQIAFSYKKIKLPCNDKRSMAAISKFIEAEHDLKRPIDQVLANRFAMVSKCIWSDVLVPNAINVWDLIPKHGPGATADGLNGNQKFKLSNWHERLEPYFPLGSTLFSNDECYTEAEFQRVSLVLEEHEKPVKVTLVPKTLKGPRIIAIEPVCMQYTQQALRSWLYKTIERHPLTRRHVNFTNQRFNQVLAKTSSRHGRFATLDLSAASDRVPYELALSMFDVVPDLRDAIAACRSTRAKLPGGQVIPLSKFASMGSALCFPVEAMYFYTLCVMALLDAEQLPVNLLSIKKVARSVFVYGDDIIVPVDRAAIVMETLQKYYCKVNMSKSYWNGQFRESCGMDAFAGEEVTPTYIRTTCPESRQSWAELISWVKTSNLLYRKGYWKTSARMIQHCERLLGKLPVAPATCSALAKESFQDLDAYYASLPWRPKFSRLGGTICTSLKANKDTRFHFGVQMVQVRSFVPQPVYEKDELDGHLALSKCLLLLEGRSRLAEDSKTDPLHLARTARHGAVTLKRRWVQVF